MEKIKTIKDLIVWQNSMDLVEKIYVITKSFPKVEQYGLTSQIRRAAVSIPSNIMDLMAKLKHISAMLVKLAKCL